MNYRLTLVATTLGLSCLIGCATTKQPETLTQPDEEQSTVVETQTVGKLRKEAIDLNNDERPDIFNYYSIDGRRRLVRKESDLNFDGGVDVISHYDGGSLTHEETDADFDGKIDWTDYYEEGVRIRQESDTDFNGAIDVWKFFEAGKIVRKERDLTGSGKPDYFEHYENGEVVRIGHDTNGDGKEDSWD